MNTKQLLRKINLSTTDMKEIKTAVSKAEQTTSGEIALALTAESDNYSFWELLASIYLSAVIFIILLPFASKINIFYESIRWAQPIWFLPAFYGIACLASIVIGFFIMNVPSIDRFIIPKDVRRSNVTHRAFQHFAESGIYETKEHSGILIFVSYMERQVRIIADSGNSSKISQDLWNIIADELSEGIKTGKTKEGFIGAIEKCGELLSDNFPASKENTNELPDGLIILEDN